MRAKNNREGTVTESADSSLSSRKGLGLSLEKTIARKRSQTGVQVERNVIDRIMVYRPEYKRGKCKKHRPYTR